MHAGQGALHAPFVTLAPMLMLACGNCLLDALPWHLRGAAVVLCRSARAQPALCCAVCSVPLLTALLSVWPFACATFAEAASGRYYQHLHPAQAVADWGVELSTASCAMVQW